MIGSDIINSIGAGSGINSGNIVEQLTEIEKMLPQKSIDDKRAMLDAQISDFGLLRSALDVLQDSANILADPSTFSAKSATFTESTSLVPSNLEDDAPAGDYSFEVLALAQAQSLSSSANFSDVTDVVGKGTLTFNFGEWTTYPATFVQDAAQESFTVTIDDSNNSLTGLRDAINAADKGVQASIINDGTGNRLVISAPSGAKNELEIVVDDDDTTDVDSSGLSRFSLTAGGTQQMIQNQIGADASLKVNGLLVSRSSNEIDDVLQGFSFTLAKASPGEIISVSIFDDKQQAKDAVSGFVEAYNAFLEAIEPVMGIDPETEEAGSLARDATARGILANIRSDISSNVPALSGLFTTLSAIGIRTELDGSLGIDQGVYQEGAVDSLNSFDKAFEDHYDAVKALFASTTSSSSDKITVNNTNKNTQTGSYTVEVTTQPQKSYFSGATFDESLSFPLDTTTGDYSFQVKVDSTTSASLTLTAKIYTSGEDVAAEIQTLINNDATLKAAFADVDVTYDNSTPASSFFTLTNRAYGASYNVDFLAAGTDFSSALQMSDTQGAATSGVNAAGTVDGVSATGSGQVLLAPFNSNAEGMSFIIEPGAGTSTVNFSRGFGGELSTLIDNYLQINGILDVKVSSDDYSLEKDLERLDDDQKTLDRRIEAFRSRMSAQFLVMESIVSRLKSSGSFLDGILDRLPFTARSS